MGRINGRFALVGVEDKVKGTDIIYNKPTRCNSGSIVFINNYKYALRVSDALCGYKRNRP